MAERKDEQEEVGCEQPLHLVHVVGLVGALDTFSARAVEGELADLIAGHAAVTLDLSDVELITSGGLAMLERCCELAARRQHRLLLRVRRESLVRRVLDVAAPPALAAALEDAPDVEEAVPAPQRHRLTSRRA